MTELSLSYRCTWGRSSVAYTNPQWQGYGWAHRGWSLGAGLSAAAVLRS